MRFQESNTMRVVRIAWRGGALPAVLCSVLSGGCNGEAAEPEDIADAGSTSAGTRCRFSATGDEATGSVTDSYDYRFDTRPVTDTIRIGTAPAPQGEYSILGCRGSQNFNDPQAEQTSFAFNYLGRLPDVAPLEATESDPNLLSCFAVYRDGEGNEWQCSRQQGGTQAGTCALSISTAEETGEDAPAFLLAASGHLECPARQGYNDKGGVVRIEFTVSE